MTSVNLGDLFYTLTAKSEGVKQTQEELRRFNATIGMTDAEVRKFNKAADLRQFEKLKKQFRDGKISADEFFSSLSSGQKRLFKYEDAAKRVQAALRAGTITQEQYNATIKRARVQFLGSASSIDGLTHRMQELTKTVQIALGPLSGVAARISAITSLANLGTLRLAAYSAAVIGAGAAMIKTTFAAANFEEALLKVSKTTDLSGSELEGLGEDIQSLAPKLGRSATLLLGISEQVGQLGVSGRKNIVSFTEAIGLLLKTTNLTADEAAIKMARLIEVTTSAPEEIKNVASVVSLLGNNFAASEKEIVKFATEIGQTTSQFKFSADQAIAFGAALASLGQRAEGSSSVIGRSLRKIDDIIRKGGKGIKELSQLTGIAIEDLRDAFEKDAAGFFVKFVAGLGNINTEVASVSQVLELFGLKGDEINRVLPVLAENSNRFAEAFALAAQEIQVGTAIEEEAARASEGFNSQLRTLMASLSTVAVEIGQNFLPAAKALIGGLNALIGDGKTLATVLTQLSIILGSLVLGGAIRFLLNMSRAMAGLTVASKAATLAARGLSAALKSLFGIPGIVLAVVEAVVILTNVFGDAEEANDKWNQSIKDSAMFLDELKNSSAETRAELKKTRLERLEDLKVELQLQQALANSISKPGEIFSKGAIPRDMVGDVQEIQSEIEKLETQIKQINFESVRQSLKEVFGDKDKITIFPDAGDEEKKLAKKLADVRRNNAAVMEEVGLIEARTIATIDGANALKAFNENLQIFNQAQAIANRLRQEPGESDDNFLKRQIDLRDELVIRLKEQAQALREITQLDALERATEGSKLLEEEILALKGGTEAWKEYKVARKIDIELDNLEKSLEGLGLEKQVIKDIIEERRILLQLKEQEIEANKKLEEAQKKLQQAAQQFATAIGDNIEDSLLSFEGFGSLFKALEQDLLRIFTRLLIIQPLIKGIQSGLSGQGGGAGGLEGVIGGFFSFFSSGFGGFFGGAGGGGGGSSLPIMVHTGGEIGNGRVLPLPSYGIGGKAGSDIRVDPNEELAILHRGETVRTQAQESELGRMLNSGGGDTFNININGATDFNSFEENLSQLEIELAGVVNAAKRSM